MKSRSLMSVGERIQEDQARRARALDQSETAKEDSHLAALAARGIRPHTGRTLWDPPEMRACEPGCPLHNHPA